MCNEVRRTVALGQIRDDFSQIRIPLRFPEGLPNLAPLESIRITDPTAIVRMGAEGAELVQRRWSWPGPGGKPVYNFRSEGREFASGRCLIPVDGFFEFTDPPPMEGAPKKRKKDKWLFTKAGEDWFCIAGLVRAAGEIGEAFTMLTTDPGPDVAPFHNRQVAVIDRADWDHWLNPAVPARDILKPLPAGTLQVMQVR
jgi:putative SOS response-associated peptidase YedK